MTERQRALTKRKFSGHQSQDAGAKHDVRNCDTVTIECLCRLSQQNPVFTATSRHTKTISTQAGACVMHCDLGVEDGHKAMTIKYEAVYEKESCDYVFNQGPKSICGVRDAWCVFWSVV